MNLWRAVSTVGSLVLALGAPFTVAGCSAPEGGRAPRVGLAGSVLPNAGLEAQGSVLLQRRPRVDWRLEASVTQQFYDDSDIVDDGNPEAGDFTQVGLSLRALTAAHERRHWTLRAGPVWFRARGRPNLVDEAGDYLGLRVGVGFETDLSERWSMGPELALITAYGEGKWELVPQLTWGVRFGL